MSSSAESISKGEEEKGNSNNPTNEMPKMTSTMETNSKGASQKPSSTSEKSKKETEEEKQLKVLIMNASGKKKRGEESAKRKQTIIDVIREHKPDLVLFQEFEWKEIDENWPDHKDLGHYKLIRNDDTKIMYNSTKYTVKEKPSQDLQTILDDHQIPTGPTGFAPSQRMCLTEVKTMGEPERKFICISWHGRNKTTNTKDPSKEASKEASKDPSKEASKEASKDPSKEASKEASKQVYLSDKDKIDEFKQLMTFLTKIHANINLPLLIAGDFNVNIKLICDKVDHPFKHYKLDATKRQKKVIDYLIASTELKLSYMKRVDLKNHSRAYNPEDHLDHDPIIAMLEPPPLSDTVPAQDEVTVPFKGLKLD